MTTQVQSAKTQQGFSLIELLVVVAIIGVLAAAGVVGYTSYLDNVKADTHKNNVVTLGKALQLTAVAANGGLKQPYTECIATTVNSAAVGTPGNPARHSNMLACVRRIATDNKFKSPYPVTDPYVVDSGTTIGALPSTFASSHASCTPSQQGKIIVHHNHDDVKMKTYVAACGFPKSGEPAIIVEGSVIEVDYLN